MRREHGKDVTMFCPFVCLRFTTSVFKRIVCVCTCVCVHVCVYMCMPTCVHAWFVVACLYICVYMCMRGLCVYMFVYMCVCEHVCVCMRVLFGKLAHVFCPLISHEKAYHWHGLHNSPLWLGLSLHVPICFGVLTHLGSLDIVAAKLPRFT